MKTLLNHLATALVAHKNCIQSGNVEWQAKWENIISQIERELPLGSGIDNGTKIDVDKSDGRNRIVMETAYHHMNENGMYDGWTEHQVLITPDLLCGFSIKFTGRNRNEIKEYLHDVFHTVLSEEYDEKILAS